MNFYQLPIVSSLNVTDPETGVPFTNDAVLLAHYNTFAIRIGTDNGTVYAARVNNDLYFISIGMGYSGYYWTRYSPIVNQCEVESTEYSTIYAINAFSMIDSYIWDIELTSFLSEKDMLDMFYDTYIDVESNNVIVVRVTATLSDQQNEGGISGEGGGDGDYDDISDPVPIPGLPTFSAANSGLISIFRPSQSEVMALGKYLWTNITDFIENLQKMFSNPMDYFIAFHIVPVFPPVDSPRKIRLGLWETSVSMPPVSSQWYEFDFGSVIISPYWNSALDYSPYTKVHLFLPFIGSVSINTDEIMGNRVGLIYRIDLLSGQCVALLSINNDVYYQFTGECSVSIPLTGADWSRIYSATIGAISNAVTGVAGVTATANRAIQNGNQIYKSALVASHIASSVDNIAGNIMGAKPNIAHTGNISGSAGLMGVRVPYFVIEYPRQSLPENYKHYVGYPSNIYSKLSSVSGYTECEQVIVNGISATDTEIAEITEALKEGVYL